MKSRRQMYREALDWALGWILLVEGLLTFAIGVAISFGR